MGDVPVAVPCNMLITELHYFFMQSNIKQLAGDASKCHTVTKQDHF